MDNEPDIQAYRKLEESRFFLDLMKKTSDEDEAVFYYGAFLTAWKSVLDVLLYDYAILFDLGFSREDRMDPKFFHWAAKRTNNEMALDFFKWWDKQVQILSKNPLWEARNVKIHRGYLENEFIMTFVPSSMSSSYYPLTHGYMVKGYYDDDDWGRIRETLSRAHVIFNPDTIEDCESSLRDMKTIIDESRRFIVEL